MNPFDVLYHEVASAIVTLRKAGTWEVAQKYLAVLRNAVKSLKESVKEWSGVDSVYAHCDPFLDQYADKTFEARMDMAASRFHRTWDYLGRSWGGPNQIGVLEVLTGTNGLPHLEAICDEFEFVVRTKLSPIVSQDFPKPGEPDYVARLEAKLDAILEKLKNF